MSTVETGIFVPEYSAGTMVEDFAWWCEHNLRQTVDQWSGQPLKLEPWQERYFSEALAINDRELPYWKIAGLCVSRKNGKTAMIAALSLYHLLEEGHLAPEVLMAASSDKQAGRLFDATVAYTRMNPELDALVHRREYIGEMARTDGMGKIIRMASDPNRAHGYNPSKVAIDELHAWTTPSLRRAWGAFTTGGGARASTQTFFITTAGDALEREESILGMMIDANETRGDVERPHDGLTISRNHQARTIIYNYSAPTEDRYDVEALKLANPASWITEDYLREQAESPALAASEVLQLHGCVWSASEERFIDQAKLEECLDDSEIPDGADVYVGIDASLSDDCTAVAWAHPLPDGRILLDAHIWAARPDVAADEYVRGGEIDPREVEDFIATVTGKRFRIREIAYDPALFGRSAHELAERGFKIAPIAQQSAMMAEAWKALYTAVNQATLRIHRGRRTVQAHFTNAVAEMTDRGWRVRKSKNTRKIDALVAGAIAHWRAAVAGPRPSVYEQRGILTFGMDDDDD